MRAFLLAFGAVGSALASGVVPSSVNNSLGTVTTTSIVPAIWDASSGNWGTAGYASLSVADLSTATIGCAREPWFARKFLSLASSSRDTHRSLPRLDR
jgi:hypothetical protein